MSKPESTRAGTVAIVCSTILWGTLWIPLRRLDGSGINGAWATTTGLLIPLAVLLPFALKRWRDIVAGGYRFFLTGACLALSFALYARGLLLGEVARVILLFYLTPVWSTLFGRVFLGEPISRRRILTIVLGLAGMAVIFDATTRVPLPQSIADWMGLGAGIIWGAALVFINRTASRPLFDRLFVQFLFLGPVFLAVALVSDGSPTLALDGTALWASVAWLMMFGLIWVLPVIALTLFGASRLDPGRVSILLMFEIIVGLSTAALFAGEPFGLRELIGAVLIIGASSAEIGVDGTIATTDSPPNRIVTG